MSWAGQSRSLYSIELRDGDDLYPSWSVASTSPATTSAPAWERVPGLTLAVTTSGGPVWMAFQGGGVEMTEYERTAVRFRLVVDGIEKAHKVNEFHNGGDEARDVGLFWVEALPPGEHDVHVEWAIGYQEDDPNPAVAVISKRDSTRTLVAVELPTAGSHQSIETFSVQGSSTAYEPLPGATLVVDTGTGPALFLFKGSLSLVSADGPGPIRVRLLVDGIERASAIEEFHDGWTDAHDVTLAWLGVMAAGPHSATVEWNTDGDAAAFSMHGDVRVLQGVGF